MLEENNAKEGFLEFSEMPVFLQELEPHHRGWVELAYLCGWRKREVLALKWADVDVDWLSLPGSRSKNKKPRRFPIIEPLRRIFDAQREYVSAIERETDRIIPKFSSSLMAAPFDTLRWLSRPPRSVPGSKVF